MKTITILSAGIFCCNIFFVSCKSMAQKNNNVVISKSSEKISCSNTGKFPLDIYSIYGVRLHQSKKENAPKLPKAYTVYRIDNNQLKPFFKSLKENNGGLINLPVSDTTCLTFTLSNSEVMSPSLAKKYPDIVSLKGHTTDNNANSLRLDYDGKKMKAEITRNNEVYFITPWQEGDTIYYLLYNKNDAGYEKVPFE